MHNDQDRPDFEHSAFAPLSEDPKRAIAELRRDPDAPEGGAAVTAKLMRNGEVWEMRGMVIHERTAQVLQRHHLEHARKVVAAESLVTGRLDPILLPDLRHPPKPLPITVHTGYPWTHRSGHVAGRANRVLSVCPRQRTATAIAVATLLAAPTLTDQA